MKFTIYLKILSILILLISFQKSNAQPITKSLLSFGIKQGVNLSKLNFDPKLEQNITTGYTGGLVIKYVSESFAGIQAEVNYSQRGWSEKLDSGNLYSRKLNYTEVPVLTHFIIGGDKTHAFLNVGPALSFYSSGKETMNLKNAGDTMLYYGRKLDSTFELGLCGGLGLMQATPIGDFQLEFRVLYGLHSLFKTDTSTNLAKSQNLVMGIILSYLFWKKDFKPELKVLE